MRCMERRVEILGTDVLGSGDELDLATRYSTVRWYGATFWPSGAKRKTVNPLFWLTKSPEAHVRIAMEGTDRVAQGFSAGCWAAGLPGGC